jgi:hypothetical protein
LRIFSSGARIELSAGTIGSTVAWNTSMNCWNALRARTMAGHDDADERATETLELIVDNVDLLLEQAKRRPGDLLREVPELFVDDTGGLTATKLLTRQLLDDLEAATKECDLAGDRRRQLADGRLQRKGRQ